MEVGDKIKIKDTQIKLRIKIAYDILQETKNNLKKNTIIIN